MSYANNIRHGDSYLVNKTSSCINFTSFSNFILIKYEEHFILHSHLISVAYNLYSFISFLFLNLRNSHFDTYVLILLH